MSEAYPIQVGKRDLWLLGIRYEVDHAVLAHINFLSDLNSQFADRIGAQAEELNTLRREEIARRYEAAGAWRARRANLMIRVFPTSTPEGKQALLAALDRLRAGVVNPPSVATRLRWINELGLRDFMLKRGLPLPSERVWPARENV